jgi:hypothetical protein
VGPDSGRPADSWTRAAPSAGRRRGRALTRSAVGAGHRQRPRTITATHPSSATAVKVPAVTPGRARGRGGHGSRPWPRRPRTGQQRRARDLAAGNADAGACHAVARYPFGDGRAKL